MRIKPYSAIIGMYVVTVLAQTVRVHAGVCDWHRFERSDSLILYCQERIVGTMRYEVTVDDSGGAVIEKRWLSARNLMSGGTENDKLELTEWRTYGFDGALRVAFQEIAGMTGKNTWRLEKTGNEWALSIIVGGTETSRVVEDVADNLGNTCRQYIGVLDNTVAAGDSWIDTVFDLTSASAIVTTTTCVDTPGGHNDFTWGFVSRNSVTGHDETVVMDTMGRLVLQEIPPLFTARAVGAPVPATVQEKNPAGPRGLDELFTIKKSRPPGRNERIALRLPSEEMLDESVRPFYILDSKRRWVLRQDTARCPESYIAGTGDGRWTEATVTMQADDPRIVSLAREIAGEETDLCAVVARMNAFVDTSVANRNVATFSSALETLNAGYGDCGEHAVLLAALLRALGIPSRLFYGLVYMKSGGGFLYHAWVGVHVGTWLFADPALGDFPSLRPLVPLVIDDDGTRALFMSRLMGKIGIEYITNMEEK